MLLKKTSVKDKKYDLLLKSLLSLKVPQIDLDSVKALPKNTLFIDAREQNEYNISTILGSVHLGFNNPDWELLKSIRKDRTLVVYCAVGFRSEKICTILKEKGFTNLYNLYGGIFEWVNCGLPVYDPAGTKCNRVHGYSKLWAIWVNKAIKVYN